MGEPGREAPGQVRPWVWSLCSQPSHSCGRTNHLCLCRKLGRRSCPASPQGCLAKLPHSLYCALSLTLGVFFGAYSDKKTLRLMWLQTSDFWFGGGRAAGSGVRRT
jgi:hypothetical protein